MNGALSTIPQKERQLIDVSREEAVKNNTYAFLLQKREQTALAYASLISDSKIIDPAQASVTPAGPGKKIIFLGALALALALTVIYILIKELLTDKILFRSEIEANTAIPIAGEIGRYKRNLYLPKGGEYKKLQNQIRQVRVAIGLQHHKTENNVILVTSAIRGEGKTFLSVQLAQGLSLSGKKVLLIDGDMRTGKVSGIFSLSDKRGLKDYLQTETQPEIFIFPSPYLNLSVMPAGSADEYAAELLLNGKIGPLLAQLKEDYDYIIFDCAPVNEEIDAYIVSEFTDITLFIVRHNYTSKKIIKNFDENILVKPLTNPAIIFNGIKPRGFLKHTMNRGYGYEI